uniref:Uncharacterized protein n=1 Tax=Anguilla anguilla TaxID=7936 RepID=A0A0E9XMJ4_ANGAN
MPPATAVPSRRHKKYVLQSSMCTRARHVCINSVNCGQCSVIKLFYLHSLSKLYAQLKK